MASIGDTKEWFPGFFTYPRIENPMDKKNALFSDPKLRNALLKYCEKEFSSENVEFIIAMTEIDEGVKNGKLDREKTEKRLIEIYDTFVKEDAPKQINLKAEQFAGWKAWFNKESKEGKDSKDSKERPRNLFITEDVSKRNVFTASLENIENLIKKDTFIRFKKSEQYRQYQSEYLKIKVGEARIIGDARIDIQNTILTAMTSKGGPILIKENLVLPVAKKLNATLGIPFEDAKKMLSEDLNKQLKYIQTFIKYEIDIKKSLPKPDVQILQQFGQLLDQLKNVIENSPNADAEKLTNLLKGLPEDVKKKLEEDLKNFVKSGNTAEEQLVALGAGGSSKPLVKPKTLDETKKLKESKFKKAAKKIQAAAAVLKAMQPLADDSSGPGRKAVIFHRRKKEAAPKEGDKNKPGGMKP